MGSIQSRTRLLGLCLGFGAVLLACALSGCTARQERAESSTPAGLVPTPDLSLAATLTAWPSPPPIITSPPTFTAVPHALWTAAASASGDSHPPVETPAVAGSQSPTGTPGAANGGSLPPSTGTVPSATSPAALVPSALGAPLGSRAPATRLLIPSLDLDVPVVEVAWEIHFGARIWRSVWQTADRAAGHHRNSANPGEAGNVVISGHHNTRGEVFRRVSEIGQPGVPFGPGDDVIVVAQDGQRFTYRVVQWDRFREEGAPEAERLRHAQYLAPTSEALLTLVTCWPYESNTHRVVVVARLQP